MASANVAPTNQPTNQPNNWLNTAGALDRAATAINHKTNQALISSQLATAYLAWFKPQCLPGLTVHVKTHQSSMKLSVSAQF